MTNTHPAKFTKLADPDVSLRSYIVSGTSAAEMEMHWKVIRQKMAVEV